MAGIDLRVVDRKLFLVERFVLRRRRGDGGDRRGALEGVLEDACGLLAIHYLDTTGGCTVALSQRHLGGVARRVRVLQQRVGPRSGNGVAQGECPYLSDAGQQTLPGRAK